MPWMKGEGGGGGVSWPVYKADGWGGAPSDKKHGHAFVTLRDYFVYYSMADAAVGGPSAKNHAWP